MISACVNETCGILNFKAIIFWKIKKKKIIKITFILIITHLIDFKWRIEFKRLHFNQETIANKGDCKVFS